MLHSRLDFPENEEDRRKLKKVQELVQHFRGEQCRDYVPKQNMTYRHWWKFDIDLLESEEEKREEEKLVCTNLKLQTFTECEM